MNHIAIGPEIDLPSWNWVGYDTARELSKYFKISVFSSAATMPACDVLMIIKHLPPLNRIKDMISTGARLIYCPIDYFQSREQITASKESLVLFDAIITHCEALNSYFPAECACVKTIEHHNKYMLLEMADYKSKGPIAWIGGCEHVPYLLKWLQQHPIDEELVLLTNQIEHPASADVAKVIAKHLNVDITIDDEHINEYKSYLWSERNQCELLKVCKAAIDIKGDTFNQQHKPATKAQKFVASGVPFATNSDSFSAKWFANRGFCLATPNNMDKWLSKDYWHETVEFGKKLREETTLEVIGQQFKQVVDHICQTNQ